VEEVDGLASRLASERVSHETAVSEGESTEKDHGCAQETHGEGAVRFRLQYGFCGGSWRRALAEADKGLCGFLLADEGKQNVLSCG